MSVPFIPEYQNKMKFADEAVMVVQPGDWLYYAFGFASYSDLDIAIAKRKEELQDVKIFSENTDCFYHAVDLVTNQGHSVIYPNSLIQYWRDIEVVKKPSRVKINQVNILDHKNRLPNIIFMAAVSPMDKDGYFGLIGNSLFDLQVLKIAQTVILEVNENICRLSGVGQDCIHISQADYIAPGSNAPLMAFDKSPGNTFKPNKRKECGRFTISKAL